MVRPRTSACRLTLALALALAALPACAGARSASKAPGGDTASAADEPLPGDVDGTLALLDRAEADLSGAIGLPPPAVAQYAQPAPPPPPEAAPPSPPSPAQEAAQAAPSEAYPAKEKGTAEDRPSSGRRSPCATACQALASMRRATDHLCGLAGDADPRCSGARERVQRAGERVHSACSACGE
jgi:hypothetical protein